MWCQPSASKATGSAPPHAYVTESGRLRRPPTKTFALSRPPFCLLSAVCRLLFVVCDCAGIAQWVVQNYEWGTGNGVPPSDRIFLEANSLSLQFTKEEKEGYGYRDAMQN